jgi:hypothetical protein
MKKVFFVLMFLMLASGVLAMSDPIVVKTQPGNEVKVYIRSLEGGPFLNTDRGIADDDGIFEAGPFFTLNQPLVNLQILILKGSEKILDEKIMNYNTNTSLNIDCSDEGCETVDVEFEVTGDVVVENETVIENETVVADDGSDIKDKVGGFFITAKAVFTNDEGSVNWIYSILGIVVLAAILVFVFMMFHKGGDKSGKPVMDDDEKELEDVEKKVKETEDKIKNVKDRKGRLEKIRDAKVKLADEEKELRELEEGGDSSKIEEQKDVVENAEDKVEKAEDN